MKKLFFIAVVAVLGLTACGPSPEELVQQGKTFLDNDNCEEAVKCFEKAIKKGNAEAMYEMGCMYDYGTCVEEDEESAAKWFKNAADCDYPEAQNQLAWMYSGGNGVVQSDEKAVKWAQLALEHGDYWESYFILGCYSVKGTVVPQDHKKAVDYLQKAADMSDLAAIVTDKILLPLYLEGDGVQDDEKAIQACCGMMADDDRAAAMNCIGMAYYNGDGVDKNMTKAFNWFKKAANAGNAWGQNNLGLMYFQGEGVTKDLSEAKYWLQKAADNGNDVAQYYLGELYAQGYGVKLDLDKAKYWWQKSAANGNENAQKQLDNLNKFSEMMSSISNVYSVSSNNNVEFSKGNLQYQPSTHKWRFAANQWDYIGDANKNISSNYSGWIDLFGWGTGNNPTNVSMNANDYSTFYDWGKNNITNGDGKKWRTLTKNEWIYLFNRRYTKSGIRFAMAIVNGVKGVILLPDYWQKDYYSLKNTNDIAAKYDSNKISKSVWLDKFEKNGAVFLPAAGTRLGTNVQYPGYSAGYWSASYSDAYNANSVWCVDGIGGVDGVPNRMMGNSVRLVAYR